jgi:hypothetical protein
MTALDRLRSHLESLTASQLRELLDARPGLLRGAPLRDLGDLAGRLVHPGGVAAALGGLSRPARQVLEVLAASGAGASERRAGDLLGPIGANEASAHARAVAQFTSELRSAALVWPAGENLDVNLGLRYSITRPLGMGRSASEVFAEVPAADLATILLGWGVRPPARKADLVEVVAVALGDPAQVRRIVAQAPEDVGDFLRSRANRAAFLAGARGLPVGAGGPFDGLGRQVRNPADYRAAQAAAPWVRDHGLGFFEWSSFAGSVEIPAEVLLALVPTGTVFPFDPEPPPLPRAAATVAQVTSSAAGALTVYLSAAMATFESVSG